jgi:hypothetical protein
MKAEMRQKLAHEPFEEKIRKVAQLVRLARTFPRRHNQQAAYPTAQSIVSEPDANPSRTDLK